MSELAESRDPVADRELVRSALLHASRYFEFRDRMNAEVHLAEPRWSEVTILVGKALHAVSISAVKTPPQLTEKNAAARVAELEEAVNNVLAFVKAGKTGQAIESCLSVLEGPFCHKCGKTLGKGVVFTTDDEGYCHVTGSPACER